MSGGNAGRKGGAGRNKDSQAKVSAKRRDTRRTDSRDSSDSRGTPQNLAEEYDDQLKYRDTVLWSVGVLKQSVGDLKEQLADLKRDSKNDGDSEFKLRCEAQRDLNCKLEEQTAWYRQELDKTRERIRQGQEYSYEADLDPYTEAELSVLVRQLERERNILYSEFRNKGWQLDNHSKEYYQLRDIARAYSGDLSVINRSLEQLWRKRSTNSIGGESVTASPGAVPWSGEAGILPTQRILDPRKGPVRKAAGVRSLPRLDPSAIDAPMLRSGNSSTSKRTRSLDERGKRHANLGAHSGSNSNLSSAVHRRTSLDTLEMIDRSPRQHHRSSQ